jgi:glycine hydroxymethyltransferase
VVSNGTDNHCMLIDLRSKGLTGKEADAVLGRVHITVNKNMVPFDDKSPFVTSGIRVGSAAVTTRGLREDDCRAVVKLIDQALTHRHDETVLDRVRAEVRAMMAGRPLYAA